MSWLRSNIDKAYHFTAGAAASLVVGLLVSPLYGLLAAIAAGILKELYDALSNARRAREGLPPNHDVDFNDALATAIGGFAISLLLLAIGI